jgi:hypothetical protein
MPTVRPTREEVQEVITLLATAEAWFSGLRCGCQKSCIDRVFRTYLIVLTFSDRAWKNVLRQKEVLVLRTESVMYVSGTPVGSRCRYRPVSLGGWYVWQLCLQRKKTTERCLHEQTQ